MTGSRKHPVDRFAPLTAGLVRLPAPPRRVSILRRLQIVDAGLPGRPLPRRLALSLLAALLAVAVLVPDGVYSRRPVAETEVISHGPRGLPSPLDTLSASLPGDLLGYTATFRLPSGDVRSGPISASESIGLDEGQSTLEVHLIGPRGQHGRPASGLFEPRLIGMAGILGLFALVGALAAAASLRRGWWMVRLARRGEGVVGRVTEVRCERLFRRGQPVGRRYHLYYDFRARDTIREGVVAGFQTERYLPFAVDGPLRVLFQPDQPQRSMPLDLLPLADSDG